jgi:uncharacterized protein YdcH (DUF465 family)
MNIRRYIDMAVRREIKRITDIDPRLEALYKKRNRLENQLYRATGVNPKTPFFSTKVARIIEQNSDLKSLWKVLDEYDSVDGAITDAVEFGNYH